MPYSKFTVLFLTILFITSQAIAAGLTSSNCSYVLSELVPQYVGEKNWGVTYLTPNERQQYAVEFKHGRVWLPNGGPRSTRNADSNRSGKGVAIFVMDRFGRFYISNQHIRNKFHHSSLVAGDPVAAAGEIMIYYGAIAYISGASGHYLPGTIQMEQLKQKLQTQGIDTTNIIFADY